jgi:hypothetical protein
MDPKLNFGEVKPAGGLATKIFEFKSCPSNSTMPVRGADFVCEKPNDPESISGKGVTVGVGVTISWKFPPVANPKQEKWIKANTAQNMKIGKEDGFRFSFILISHNKFNFLEMNRKNVPPKKV